jgi:hypothetical protein
MKILDYLYEKFQKSIAPKQKIIAIRKKMIYRIKKT